MKFKTLTGRVRDINLANLLIDWDGDFASDFEAEVADWFYPYWKNDLVVTQLPIGQRMTIDFYNVKQRVAIEVQGRQHSAYVPFLSGSRAGYLGQLKRDMKKAKWCEINEITLVEIHPKDMPLTKKWVESTFSITL